MRFTNERYSPSKYRGTSPLKIDNRNQFNKKIKEEKSYFHYNNAVYMGEMISYKRNGTGIVLYDEGTSAIIQTNYESPTGHSVFFRQNLIASMLHLKKGNYEMALRMGHYIFKLPFYEMDNIPNGSGVLIDYNQMKMHHLFYDAGRLVKKVVETNYDVLQRVFSNDLRKMIDPKHENAFKFNLNYDNGIKIAKKTNKFTIGYIDHRNNKEGLCFKLSVSSQDYDKFEYDLETKPTERGFYVQNRLQNYGERYFVNGNYYIGQFWNDNFEGKGLLMYPAQIKGKWVHGIFQDNKLIKMLQMSLGAEESQPSRTSPRNLLKKIHEQNYKNWIGSKIECIDWNMLINSLEQAIELHTTDVVVQKAKFLKQEEQRLYLIQKHFMNDKANNQINKILLAQKDVNEIHAEKIILNQYSSLGPKALEIEPRSMDNEGSWTNSREQSPHLSQLKSSKIKGQNKLNIRQDILVQSRYESSSSRTQQTMTPTNAAYLNSLGRTSKGLKNFNTLDTLQD